MERFEPRDELTEYPFAGTYSFARGIFVGERKLGSTFALPKIQRIRAGDFIYCKIMAWEGAFGVATKEADNCVMSGAFVVYELNRDKIDEKFLDYFFKVPDHWQSIGSQSSGTNVRRQSLHPSQFERAEIPLPPLGEQRRVVARIEELAARIHEARTLRHQAAEEAEALVSRSAETILLDGFPKTRLEAVCPIITDGTHQTPRYTEEGAIFLSAKNVKPFRFMPEEHRWVSVEDFRNYTARTKPRRGDVLLTRVGAGIGEAAVVDQDIEFAIYVSLALIRTDSTRLAPEFLVHWLNSPSGRASSHRETLGRGHSQGNLNLKLLRGVELPVPPLTEQRRIVAELDALQAEVDALKRLQAETAAELDALLPALLDRAFKGELE
jgi:type I restriction enzyme S subunit